MWHPKVIISLILGKRVTRVIYKAIKTLLGHADKEIDWTPFWILVCRRFLERMNLLYRLFFEILNTLIARYMNKTNNEILRIAVHGHTQHQGHHKSVADLWGIRRFASLTRWKTAQTLWLNWPMQGREAWLSHGKQYSIVPF